MVDAAEPVVLWIVSELGPDAQVGGLGDVARTLPPLLREAGVDVRVCVPKYRVFKKKPAREGHIYYLDLPELFDRDYIYGSAADDAYRFGVFAKAAVALGKEIGATILHAHDWQAGFAPVFAKGSGMRTIFTVHNVAYQGVVGSGVIPTLGLPWDVAQDDGYGAGWQMVNLLKGAVRFADTITTVSETHARDIQTPEGGFGLHQVFAARKTDLVGIMNGIDTVVWDPSKEPKRPERSRPLLASIGRLAEQKGIDLLIEAAKREDFDFDLFVIGKGEAHLEAALQKLAAERPDRVQVAIVYDEQLTRKTFASADFFVMPSRFEPAGLAQLQAQRYGAIPIVRRTGGLGESVTDMGDPGGNGICFSDPTVPSLAHALSRARALFADRPALLRLRDAAMRAKVDWRDRLPKYVNLYTGPLSS
jgi:starch synthase